MFSFNKKDIKKNLNMFNKTEFNKNVKSYNTIDTKKKNTNFKFSLRKKSKNDNIKSHINKFNKKIKIKSFQVNNNIIELKKFFKEKFKNIKLKKNKPENKDKLIKKPSIKLNYFNIKEEINNIKITDFKFDYLNKKTDVLIKELDIFLSKIKTKSMNNKLYFDDAIKENSYFSNYKNYLKSFKNMMSKIKKDYNNVLLHFKKLNYKKKEYIDFFESKFTKEELDIIKIEFKKKKNNESYNINKLYYILKKLYFFKKINKEYALIFIKNADLIFMKKEKFLFKKGDIAKNMYVILSGNVTVCFDYFLNSLGYNFKNTITQLDDGYDFGNLIVETNNEINVERNISNTINEMKQKIMIWRRVSLESDLINENLNKMKNVLDLKYLNNLIKSYNHFKEENLNKEIINNKNELRRRVADIYTTENTYFIQIENKIYNEYILKPFEKENNEKLELILKIPLFKDIPKVLILPLIQILKKKKFKFGERILKENNYSEYIFFINKGIIDVVINTIESYEFNKNFTKREGTQKNFNFSIDKNSKNKVFSFKTKSSIRKSYKDNNRVFDGELFYDKESSNRIKTSIKSKLLYVKSLKKFSFFGEMCLVNKNNYPQKWLYLKKPEIYTYIVNTAEVELFYFSSNEFHLLSKPIKKVLKKHIFNYDYEEELNIKEKFKLEKNNWKKYKINYVAKEKKYNFLTKILKNNDYKKI